jgi:hypothetical protein
MSRGRKTLTDAEIHRVQVALAGGARFSDLSIRFGVTAYTLRRHIHLAKQAGKTEGGASLTSAARQK